jgi:hypothetical protein
MRVPWCGVNDNPHAVFHGRKYRPGTGSDRAGVLPPGDYAGFAVDGRGDDDFATVGTGMDAEVSARPWRRRRVERGLDRSHRHLVRD